MSIALDHVVVAAPDLRRLVDSFTELTGITPIPGGRHDFGTANALVPLAGPAGSYIELIGPDPDAEAGLLSDVFAIASTRTAAPRVAAWCVRPSSLEGFVDLYRELRVEPNSIEPMVRHAPDGSTLTWRLIHPVSGLDHAPLPFAIDWLDTAHPSTVAAAEASVVSLTVRGGGEALAAIAQHFVPDLAAVVRLAGGEPHLDLVLRTPNGEVDLADLVASSGRSTR